MYDDEDEVPAEVANMMGQSRADPHAAHDSCDSHDEGDDETVPPQPAVPDQVPPPRYRGKGNTAPRA